MPNHTFEKLIDQFPFPVAFSCRFILTRSDRRSMLESIIDAYESLVRFLALVVISDYLRGLIQEPRIDKRLKKLFGRRISPGHWVEILRETLRVYCSSPEKMFIPELLEFYFAGKKFSSEVADFEKWVNRRNDFRSHAKHLITEKFLEKTWAKWWPEFQEMIARFAFLGSYEMIIPAFIQRNTIKKAQLCTGPEQFFIFQDDYDLPLKVKGVEPKESLLLVDKRTPGRQLLLYPFIVVKAPADFYLFEQGERLKGNLHRVVFAALGPGIPLEIGRQDANRRILEDLELKLSRLGEIGIYLDDVPVQAMRSGAERPALQEAIRTAALWAEEGYPYYVVEGISARLKGLILHPPEDIELEDEGLLAFVLIAALHYGGNWAFWLRKNTDNATVIGHLIKVLSISYVRPRFRALFVLQSFAVTEIKKIMDNPECHLSSDMRKIITKYVLCGKVTDYLTTVKKKADPDMAKKAASVLAEIDQYFRAANGRESRSGLPPA